MNQHSDIDIAVIEDTCENIRLEQNKIQISLRNMGYPFDVVVMTKEYFEKTKNFSGSLAQPISKNGKLLYER